MRFWDLFHYSFEHLKHRGLRTWLTMLGIVVAISAVILLVGVAQGLQGSVTKELEIFGPDLLVIVPINVGAGGASLTTPSTFIPTSGKLFEKDMNIVSRVDGVGIVSKGLRTKASIKYKKKQIGSYILGLDLATYADTHTFEIQEGRLLEGGDRKVVLIGSKVASEIFDEEVQVNSIIEISGEKYRVVGILKETGTTYADMDSIIITSFEDAKRIAGNTINDRELSLITLKVSEGYDPIEVEGDIEWALMRSRKVTEDEKDFGIVSARFIQEKVNSIIGALTIFLTIVSGVSLLVGAIGISNTMFMSVLERTREIGVLKSIGATSEQIQDLFLMESAMIGLSGGICGLVLGFLLLELITFAGFGVSISIEIVVFVFIFSVAIGIAAGTFPARSASKVPAIEALRYE